MNRNILLIGFLAILLLTFSSCSFGSSSGGRGSSLGNYRTGSQGLDIYFQTNSPPATLFAEDESIPVSLEIYNRGVYPGENDETLSGHLYFVGYDPDIIGGIDSAQQVVFEPEEAKTRYNPEGSITIVSLDAEINSIYFTDKNIDEYSTQIDAILCYPYKTFASVDVCVDPNPNKNEEHDGCRPGVTGAGSQGAPVAVTSVESISQRGKARFVITIANIGNGDVIRDGSAQRCISQEFERDEYDKILINEVTLSNGQPLDCSPSREIRLINGQATLICKAEGIDQDKPAYNTILQVELSYDYKTTTSRPVRILGE